MRAGVGSGHGMDSSVIPSQKYKDFFMVSTTDFFYPSVEDPYNQVLHPLLLLRLRQGKIACANVVSDMYAMGVVDVDNILMILAASRDMDEKHRDIVTKLMMKGFDG